MVKLTHSETKTKRKKRRSSYNRLVSIGEISLRALSDMSKPIDAANRFINLALHTTEESSQSRQFLLESKQGIRKTSLLLKRLNSYARKMESEVRKISKSNKRVNR